MRKGEVPHAISVGVQGDDACELDSVSLLIYRMETSKTPAKTSTSSVSLERQRKVLFNLQQ